MLRVCRSLLLAALVACSAAACDRDERAQPTPANPETSAAAAETSTTTAVPEVTDTADVPSAAGAASGCGAVPPVSGPFEIDDQGLLRTGLLHVPSGYDAATPTPLVLNFHGYTSSADAEELVSRFSVEADAGGFLVVYPNGSGSPQGWNSGTPLGATDVDDVAFTLALLDHVSTIACVDRNRVFATGYSNGGGMSDRLACDVADRITAIAPVAGLYATTPCEPSRPVPVIAFHGVLDSVVRYDGGERGSLPVEEWAAAWAARNGCPGGPVSDPPVGAVVRLSWDGCAAPVEFYRVENGGHTWPGGLPVPLLGYTNQDISATALAWAFFAAAAPTAA